MEDIRDRGDLGRRVARRRAELGLSVAQLAERAGMAPGYIDYLERHTANITTEMLYRLAAALLTSDRSLLGEGADRPSGGSPPGPRPVLERLSDDECRRLIAPGGVGRVVFTTDHGPEALPVTYRVDDDAIVFRTAPGTVLTSVIDTDVGFEVDRLDEALSEGWSVLAFGPARRIHEPAAVWRLGEDVKPWAGGDRDVFVRVEPRRITGRRIRSG